MRDKAVQGIDMIGLRRQTVTRRLWLLEAKIDDIPTGWPAFLCLWEKAEAEAEAAGSSAAAADSDNEVASR